MSVNTLKEKILQGYLLDKAELMSLWEEDLESLCSAANEIREKFCKDGFDICSIINGKSGRCSEDCKYCAQSAHYNTCVEEYPLKSKEEILELARYNAKRGVLRYSIVTSGKCMSDAEVEELCEAIRLIKNETGLEVCISLGLLSQENYAKIKEAGASRVHNNLETSRRNFPNVCTTHTYDDKLAALKAAKASGLSVCSGGIVDMGETREDRVDMILDIRELGIHSVPVNMLNPIPGTPYENMPPVSLEEMRRIVAVFRFAIPDASIRLAGGRGLMHDKGRACFVSGANAAISGDMLTTSGITIERDMRMLEELGYTPKLWED